MYFANKINVNLGAPRDGMLRAELYPYKIHVEIPNTISSECNYVVKEDF